MKLSEFLVLDQEEQEEILRNQSDENFIIFLCNKYPNIIKKYVKNNFAGKLSDNVVIITGLRFMEYYVEDAFAKLLMKDSVIGQLIFFSESLRPTNMDGKEVSDKHYGYGASKELRPYENWKIDTKDKLGIRFSDEFPQDSFKLLFEDCKELNYLEEW